MSKPEQAAAGVKAPPISFLAHHEGDDVAVAVTDMEPGETRGAYQDSGRDVVMMVKDPIPLGHKFALQDLGADQPVVKYGITVGTTRTVIGAGEHVHVHNMRSARWQTS